MVPPTRRSWRGAVLLASLAGMGLAAACARQGAPPGGPEDRRPPMVVATRPDTYAVVEDFDESVRFTFDERISERVTGGTLDGAVLVSPRTGEVRVEHSRGALEVSLAGGFRPETVYRVTLLPVVSDLFGNQIREPFELVFSTGAELVPSAVAGLAWDRATGRGLDGLSVVARDTRDSTVYVARTDTAGIYAFRYLPPGPYQVTAFEDRNADEAVDLMEVQGTRLIQISGADTIVAEIGVLEPDTTAATLTAAQVLDSVTLTLRFDDPLDPMAGLRPGNVSLRTVAQGDSAAVLRGPEGEVVLDEDATAPQVVSVFHEHEYASWVAAAADSLALADSLDRSRAAQARQEGETEVADSLMELVPRSVPTRLSPEAGGGRGGRGRPAASSGGQGEPGEPERGPDGRPLPSRRLVVRLDRALVPNRGYQVAATGVENLSHLPLGGGTAVVVREPPPPPDTAQDTLAVDSADAVPDTAQDTVAVDSADAVPDTGAATPDSVPPPPDTVLVAVPRASDSSPARRRRPHLPFVP